MPYEHRTRRRVEFCETDLAGIVHFGNYFRYMESAEHEFLRSLGLSVHGAIDGRGVSFPRVRAECSYKAPLRFEDEFEIHLLVREKRRRSLVYDFRFHRGGPKPIAHGAVTVVCVAIDPETGHMTSIAIPPAIDAKIEQAPDELLKG